MGNFTREKPCWFYGYVCCYRSSYAHLTGLNRARRAGEKLPDAILMPGYYTQTFGHRQDQRLRRVAVPLINVSMEALPCLPLVQT